MIAAAAVGEQIRSGGEYAGLPPFITSGTRTGLCHATGVAELSERGTCSATSSRGRQAVCAALVRCGTVGRA